MSRIYIVYDGRANYDEDEAYRFSDRRHIGLVLPLDDGRRLVVGHPHRPHHPGLLHFFLALALCGYLGQG